MSAELGNFDEATEEQAPADGSGAPRRRRSRDRGAQGAAAQEGGPWVPPHLRRALERAWGAAGRFAFLALLIGVGHVILRERAVRGDRLFRLRAAHAEAEASAAAWAGAPGADPAQAACAASAFAGPSCAEARTAALRRPPTAPAAGWALIAAVGPEAWLHAWRDQPLPALAWGPAPTQEDDVVRAAALGAALRANPGSVAEAQRLTTCLHAFDGGPTGPACPLQPSAAPGEGAGTAKMKARVSGAGSARMATGAAQVAVAVERREPVPPGWATAPGLGGALALELADRGDPADLPLLLHIAEAGGAPLDRVAALAAAAALQPPASWPPGPARDRALALAP
ncbi:MAG: hypothetical protein RL071_2473 [Pseudomonadota bacterium]